MTHDRLLDGLTHENLKKNYKN